MHSVGLLSTNLIVESASNEKKRFLAIFATAGINLFSDRPKATVNRGGTVAFGLSLNERLCHYHTIYVLHDVLFGTADALHIILHKTNFSKEPPNRLAIDSLNEHGLFKERRNEC